MQETHRFCADMAVQSCNLQLYRQVECKPEKGSKQSDMYGNQNFF